MRREPHPTDRRALVLRPTPGSDEEVRKTLGAMHERMIAAAGALSEDEADTVIARATWRVFESVCGESPMLVGHSMGTQVVVEMALQRPSVRKAALLAPTVNERERTVPRQALRLLQDGLVEPWGLKAILAWD